MDTQRQAAVAGPAQVAPAAVTPGGPAAPAAPPPGGPVAPAPQGTPEQGSGGAPDLDAAFRRAEEHGLKEQNAQLQKRVGDRQAEHDRLIRVEKELKALAGDNYLEVLTRRSVAAQAVPQPATPAPTVAAPSPAPSARPISRERAGEIHAEFIRAWSGGQEYVFTPDGEIDFDPSTSKPKTRATPPDPGRAQEIAEEYDARFRAAGFKPPWPSNLVTSAAQAAPTPQPQSQAHQPEQVSQGPDAYSIYENQKQWAAEFRNDVAATAKRVGYDWFNEQIPVPSEGGRELVMTRYEYLEQLSAPTRENPRGIPLLKVIPLRALVDRIAYVADQRANAGGAPGAVNTSGSAGPVLGPSERKQRADEMRQQNLTDETYSADPPPNQARQVRVVGGRLSV